MCEGCLSSSKEMTKDVEETMLRGVFLVQSSRTDFFFAQVGSSCEPASPSSCEPRDPSTQLWIHQESGFDDDTSSDGATKVMMLMQRRKDVKLDRLELGLAKAHLVIRETIQTDNQPPLTDKHKVLVGPVYWNAYAFQRMERRRSKMILI